MALTAMMHTAYTAEITSTYNTGDTLTAATLDAIKAAVNDNNTRIETNATTPGATGAVGATGPAGTNAAGPSINMTAPTKFNDYGSYSVGSIWVDTAAAQVYISIDSTDDNAVWHRITSGSVTYAIGDTGPAGGKVFYVSNGGINGLEAAPSDSAETAWGVL